MSLRYNIKNDIIDVKTYIYFKPTESNKLDDIKFLLEHEHDKIDIYPNNDNSYENVRDNIYRIITKTEFLCKSLNHYYILNSFHDNDAVVIIGDSKGILPNGNIFGFAIIKFDEESNSIYVDVICSHIGIKGAGDILMKKIEYICIKVLMTKIYLKSVKSAISFYERYGFIKYDKICDNMCLMIKSMNKKNGGKRKTQKKTRKKNKTRKNRRLKCKKV
jgi:hypothetical protein